MPLCKSYFDGANQADSTQYDVISLASISRRSAQWRNFEREWQSILKKHGAPYLHITDVVSLARPPFTRENGWNKDKRDAFLLDCVAAIETHTLRPSSNKLPLGKLGLLPYIVTVPLKEFLRARSHNPEVPKDVTELCAVQAVARAHAIGQIMKADFYHLIFD